MTGKRLGDSRGGHKKGGDNRSSVDRIGVRIMGAGLY